MRKCFALGIVCLCCGWILPAFSQQISPLDLVIHPELNKGAFTGIGGGDANSLRASSAASSAQGAFEFNFFTEKNARGNRITFPIIFRYNFINSSRIFQRDTFNIRNIAFVDNNQILNFGLRRRSLKEIGDDYFLKNFFLDGSFNQYSSLDSGASLINFYSYNVSTGWQLGFLMDTDVGAVGILGSIQGNYVNVSDESPESFERALQATSPLSRDFAGWGFRLQLQFNDISVFFEGKKYYPIGQNSRIDGFTDRMIISFGGNAMGTLLKFKKKNHGN